MLNNHVLHRSNKNTNFNRTEDTVHTTIAIWISTKMPRKHIGNREVSSMNSIENPGYQHSKE